MDWRPCSSEAKPSCLVIILPSRPGIYCASSYAIYSEPQFKRMPASNCVTPVSLALGSPSGKMPCGARNLI